MTPSSRSTPSDLPFDRGRSRSPGAGGGWGRLASVGGRSLYWAPVWIPALVCLQLAAGGLWPSVVDQERLSREEAYMDTREGLLWEERDRLERDLSKLADPIYRERVRRSLRIAGAAPLTLDMPHVGELAPR